MCCLKCKQNEATSSSPFCYDCLPGWLKSDERASVDWLSDESYDAAAKAFAEKPVVVENTND